MFPIKPYSFATCKATNQQSSFETIGVQGYVQGKPLPEITLTPSKCKSICFSKTGWSLVDFKQRQKKSFHIGSNAQV